MVVKEISNAKPLIKVIGYFDEKKFVGKLLLYPGDSRRRLAVYMKKLLLFVYETCRDNIVD